jgi:N12 class adenine-specific DNA methylase
LFSGSAQELTAPAELTPPPEPGELKPSTGERRHSTAPDEAPPVEDFDLAGMNIGAGGLAQKYRDNITAIRILKAMEEYHRPATPDERRAIARYVGWGALKGVFDPENRQWNKEHNELKGLLTEEEWVAARRSMLNAHYTSPTIVTAVHEALAQAGFRSGRVLEPSVGVGNFFGLMPADVRKASELHGVELDPLTAQIATALYPSASIKNTGFQDFDIPSEYFDVVIGNPPFGNEPLVDMQRSPYSGFSIHNYFFGKSIDKLRPGGMMAMVVSRYFMDAIDSRARKWISERADLVSAVRLPRTAFKENAGTEVVTDILVFRKHDRDQDQQRPSDAQEKQYGRFSLEELRNLVPRDAEAAGQLREYIHHRERLAEIENWVNVGMLDTVDQKTGEMTEHHISGYFIKHPENVLGTHSTTGTLYRANDYSVEPSGELAEQLNEWVGRMPTGIYHSIERTKEAEVANVAVPDGVKVNSYFVSEDGVIMIRGEDLLGRRTANSWDAPNARAIERVKGMIGLRDGIRQQMRLELSDTSSAEIERSRAVLNAKYDAFLKAYGYLNDPTNRRLFFDDTEAPLVLALEFNYDKDISKSVAAREDIAPREPSATKADILSQRVLFPPRDGVTVETAHDALVASLNYRGRFDLPYMESIYPKPSDEIIKELGDLVFDDPLDGVVLADEYLSGDVKTKLSEAKAAAKSNSIYQRNVTELEKVIPVDKRPSEINAQLGAVFIPPQVFIDFGEHVTGSQPRMVYAEVLGQWFTSWSGVPDPSLNSGRYGTERMSARDIFESTIAGRGVVVMDRDSDGKAHINLRETESAREKQQIMKDEWKRWLWSDPERAVLVAGIYNEKLNRVVPRKFDGSHLSLPGLSPAKTLRPHQKNAVWRALQSRQVLFDHVVGAGKTLVIVSTFMEMRRLGLCRKPLIAVPNHLTLQWQSEFVRFFPGARVLAATPDDFTKGNRERFFSKIVTGDWDAVIVGHSSLKKIGLSPELENKFTSRQVKELAKAIESAKRTRGDRNIVRDMERIKARLEAQIEKKKEKIGERDKVLSFDELGLDAVAVDELHEFKNLYYNSTMDRVPGMGNPAGSDKAFDLFMKTQFMWETYGDNAILLGATGTPISNSMVEMFNLQRYMQYPTLKENGLHVFDAWARQFANAQSVYEVAPSGMGYRQSSRLEFSGVNALMPLYQSFTDTVTQEQLVQQARDRGEVFPIPKIFEGRPINVVAPRSPAVAAFIGEPQLKKEDGNPVFGLMEGDAIRFESFVDNKGEERWKTLVTQPRKNGTDYEYTLSTTNTLKEAQIAAVQAAVTPEVTVDDESILGQFANLRSLMISSNGKINALSLTGKANKAGLDYRLIDPSAPDFPSSKINMSINNMVMLYEKWSADRGTQLIFCDLSIPLSARKSLALKDSRIYVRDPETGALQHRRGTLHTVSGYDEIPYYIVKSDKALFSIFDAASGAFVDHAESKDDAKIKAEARLNNEVLRTEWIVKRESFGGISQEDIDDYNVERNYESAAEAEISIADVVGVSGAQGFSVYDDIKSKLVGRGIPEKEIAFIHDYTSILAKDRLFKAVNRGEIRFLLGSTPKMGAGTNVQERLIGLHHIDAPWRPSDLEQREGRIIRQGNALYARDPEGFEVALYRYATEKTYDTRRWQLLEHKARMISQIRNYDGAANSVEDIAPEAANAADMKAAASGDPLILEETRLKDEVRRLDLLQSAHADEISMLAYRARDCEHWATQILATRLNALLSMQRDVEQYPVKEDGFQGIEIDGRQWMERSAANQLIEAKVQRAWRSGTEERFRFRGVEFTVNGEHKDYIELSSPLEVLAQFDKTKGFPPTSGFVTRFSNFVDRIPSKIKDVRADIERYQRSAQGFRAQAELPFDKATELEIAKKAYRSVQRQLIAKGPEVPKEDRYLLDAAVAKQREWLEKIGLGEAVREFFEKKTDRSDGEVRHLYALQKLDQNRNVFAGDARFSGYTEAELTKAAFYRGICEKQQELDGRTPDMPKIDETLSNRATLVQLPDVNDIKSRVAERRFIESAQGKTASEIEM